MGLRCGKRGDDVVADVDFGFRVVGFGVVVIGCGGGDEKVVDKVRG